MEFKILTQLRQLPNEPLTKSSGFGWSSTEFVNFGRRGETSDPMTNPASAGDGKIGLRYGTFLQS